MMGEAIIMCVCAVGFAASAALLPTSINDRRKRQGMYCVGALGVATLIQLIAFVGRSGHGVDVLVFSAVIAALTSFTVAVVYAMRHRAPADDATEPEPQQAPRTNYIHAYGTYDSTTIKAARADAQRIRRGARA